MMHVADDTDDLKLFGVALVLIRADVRDALANWVFVCEVAARQGFVDDGNAGAAALILFSEVTPSAQRNLDGFEVVDGNAAVVSVGLLPRLRSGASFNPEIAADIAAAEGHR